MRLKGEISRREMVRRFALGEVDSTAFRRAEAAGAFDREEVRRKLAAEDSAQQEAGIEALYAIRPWLRDWPPPDTQWHLASLEFTEEEFRRISTFPCEGWTTLTRGTHRLLDAAETIARDPLSDPRTTEIIEALRADAVNWTGITVLSNSLSGPYTALEGNGRLVALYLCCVQDKSCDQCPGEIDVALGLVP